MPLTYNALTTVESVRKNLSGCLIDLDNDLIEQKINEASQFVETYINRKLGKSSYFEKHMGDNGQHLSLKQYPVIQLNQITIDGVVVDSSNYDLYEETGIVYKPDLWPKPLGGKRNISVQYEAGYVLPKDENEENSRTLPFDIEAACIYIASTSYKNRDAEGLKDRRIGDYSETFLNDLPFSIKAILDSYKKRV